MKYFVLLSVFFLISVAPLSAQKLAKNEKAEPWFYIKGKTDQERWKTFLDAQPRLIAMSYTEVREALGPNEKLDKNAQEVYYSITKELVKIGPMGRGTLHVKIVFYKGLVSKFTVEPDCQEM